MTEKRTEPAQDVIAGRNAVKEALRSARPIESILVARGARNGSLGDIVSKAKAQGVAVKEVDPKRLEFLCPGANHQGIVALAAAHEYASVEDPLLVLCDGITDPHNLGAILRTAECTGAHGVIIPKRRSAGLTYTVGKASAGALEYVPVARVSNLAAALEDLKKRGLWIYGADMEGTPWCEAELTGPAALVIGSEGAGIGRLVKEKCDVILSLPMRGKINSLNASVAAGVLMYEFMRQRQGIKAK